MVIGTKKAGNRLCMCGTLDGVSGRSESTYRNGVWLSLVRHRSEEVGRRADRSGRQAACRYSGWLFEANGGRRNRPHATHSGRARDKAERILVVFRCCCGSIIFLATVDGDDDVWYWSSPEIIRLLLTWTICLLGFSIRPMIDTIRPEFRLRR